MNKIYLCLLTVGLSLSAALAHADEAAFARVMKTKTLNCGYIIVPPYITKDANTGKMGGINYEMMEAIGRNLGVKINWSTEIGVGDVAAALAANKFDVMCQTLWPSAARYNGVTLANRPEFYSAIYAVVRADDKRFDADLAKANIATVTAAAVDGDFSADLVAEKLPNAKKDFVAPSASLGDYIMQLTTKKADILFMDKGSMNDFAKTSPDKIKIVPGIPAVRIYGEHLAVKPGEYRLRDMVDMATLQLVNDGTFEDLVKRYAAEYKTEIYASKRDIAK